MAGDSALPDSTLTNWSYPRVLAGALALAVAITLLWAGVTSTAAFGAYNPSWDGASELRTLPAETGTGSAVVQDVTAYENATAAATTASATADAPANGTLAIVLSPDEPYAEPAALRRFVVAGGTLLVAEDFGPHGNDLLSAVGASARVDGRPLRDEHTHGPSPAFPVATNLTDHAYTVGVGALELNHGTAVQPGNASVLTETSPFAYLDADGDGELDDGETLATHPVVTVESVGEGRVVTVGDPSLFLNAMLEERDNRGFARAIVAAHDHVLLDTSHTSDVPAVVAARSALQETAWLQLAIGLGVVAAIIGSRQLVALAGRVRGRRDGDDPLDAATVDREAAADAIARRNPGWESDRVARVTDTIMSRQAESRHNDRSE